MGINLGTGAISKLYLGATEIQKAYLGGSLVYDAAPSYLLDTYSAAAAYSLRQLKTGISNVVRVTDSGNNSEADYTPAQVTAGLTAIGSDNGLVALLYDQGSSSYNAAQTTLASQPVILNAGTLVTLNTKPAIDCNNDFGWQSSSYAFSALSEYWVFCVIEKTNAGVSQIILETTANADANNGAVGITVNASNNILVFMRNSASNYALNTYTVTETGQILISVRIRASQTAANFSELYVNGSAKTKTNGPNSSTAFVDGVIALAARGGASLPLKGKMQEAILITGDQSSNRTAIEANINTYYGIY